MKNTLFMTTGVLLTLATVSAAFAEIWECDSPNDGLPQSLSVEISAGKPVAFSYVGMAPAPDGTKYSCSFEAKRSDGHSDWTYEGTTVRIKLKDSMDPSDVIELTDEKDSYKLSIQASYQNCGHSTPFASQISITKNKKQCHDIEMHD